MEDQTKDGVEELREARQTANSVYMKFSDDSKCFSNVAFCFFEGEDAKYYNLRIRRYFGNNYITYTVGNKKEVLKIMDRIEGETLYSNVIKMFFVDRDYDESLLESSNNLYETPCYSIENLYAQKQCFEEIIQAEFGINKADSDYVKCIKDFENRINDFLGEIEEFNAFVLYRRKHTNLNSNFRFSSVKTSKLISIDVDSVTRKDQYDEKISHIKNVLNVDEIELNRCRSELQEESNKLMRYRGKNQLDFMCIYLNQLKELNNNGKYFSQKHNCVKLNLTANRLSELSQYALTPPCLLRFLELHSEIMKIKKISM